MILPPGAVGIDIREEEVVTGDEVPEIMEEHEKHEACYNRIVLLAAKVIFATIVVLVIHFYLEKLGPNVRQ